MRRQFGPRLRTIRNAEESPGSVRSELRRCLEELSQSINRTVNLLDRLESDSRETDEDGPAADPVDPPLIPNRRSQLLARLDKRPRFRRKMFRQNWRQGQSPRNVADAGDRSSRLDVRPSPGGQTS